MAVVPNRVTVSSSAAARLDVTPDSPNVVGSQSQKGFAIAIKNIGPASVYLGGDGSVTDTTGYEFASGGELFFTFYGDDQLYGRCASGATANIQVLQTGV